MKSITYKNNAAFSKYFGNIKCYYVMTETIVRLVLISI